MANPKTCTPLFVVHLLMLACLFTVAVVQVVSISGGGSSGTIVARAEHILRQYPANQLEKSIHHALETVDNMHRVSAKVKLLSDSLGEQEMQEMLKHTKRISENLGAEQLQALVNATQAIERHLARFHEIKLHF